ncbi:MAG: response regulator [Verrucomicrobia bacterium]|nr:response regulator [Verrucomicrobiota bacterium]
MEPETGDLNAAPSAAYAGRERVTALIIDDEVHVRAFLRTALRSLGLKEVHEAHDGEDGVAKFRQLQPALVLLDINMPVLSGEAAIQQIMEIDPEAVIIMITSDGRHESVRKFLDLGASGYVLKYRTADGVRAALDELLSGFDVVVEAA